MRRMTELGNDIIGSCTTAAIISISKELEYLIGSIQDCKFKMDRIFGSNGPCMEEAIYGCRSQPTIRFRPDPKFVIIDPYEVAERYWIDLPDTYDSIEDAQVGYLELKDLLLKKGFDLYTAYNNLNLQYSRLENMLREHDRKVSSG